MRRAHTYSPATREALRVLGLRIAAARRERKWTTVELSERVGISVPTLRSVERGEPTVAIGVAFETATIVGVELYGDPSTVSDLRRRAEDRLALLPASVRMPEAPVRNDF
ncbi:helix-turn-helix transcriptional regulator [Leifsonia sp. Leaf264]|uniref:helix-turn-helix transcriptional regulator n=1 Tax=Leifsonia sp. Leaf264 TaxID=1736314 RepID=UPI0006FEB603|nr:helix-turn-helix transcriptional regulator [Leifsonia sp. Leaf264]KQO98455.1 hypothetical protein ASF30_10360 [Leifsonia sp. Leaf264]